MKLELINKEESIREYLENLSGAELINLWNDSEPGDDYIFINDEYFFEEQFGSSVDSAVRAVCYGDYNYSNDYVKFDGYANLVSFSEHNASEHIDLDILVDAIMENSSYFGIELIDEEDAD